jgi:hypothetical protein
MTHFGTIAVALLLGMTSSAQAARYVSTSGDDSSDCTTTSAPCATVGHAISMATAGESVYVATGRYNENVVANNVSVSILGGYDETFTFQGNEPSTIRGGGSRALHFSYTGSTSALLVLDGLKIAGSTTLADSEAFVDGGGGLRIEATDTAEVEAHLTDSVVTKNTANYGGGIGLETRLGGKLTFVATSSVIAGNKAAGCGGLSSVGFGAHAPDVVLDATTFVKNKAADYGGAMCWLSIEGTTTAFSSISRSTFSKNKSRRTGGALYIFSFGGNLDLSMENSVFVKNAAASFGGAVYAVASQSASGIAAKTTVRSTNNTLNMNKTPAVGGSLAVVAVATVSTADIEWISRNDINYDNQGGDFFIKSDPATTATVSRYDGIQGPAAMEGPGSSVNDSNVVDVDPLLIRPGIDIHLAPASPAIDAVSCVLAPADDIDGDARPQSAMCDIGADEKTL